MEIPLPNDFVTNIGTNVTDQFLSLAPVSALIIGILLAFFLIEFIIDVMHTAREREMAIKGGADFYKEHELYTALRRERENK